MHALVLVCVFYLCGSPPFINQMTDSINLGSWWIVVDGTSHLANETGHRPMNLVIGPNEPGHWLMNLAIERGSGPPDFLGDPTQTHAAADADRVSRDELEGNQHAKQTHTREQSR